MSVQLILVPYDSGHRGVRMGAGPEHLLRHGAASRLRGTQCAGAELVESTASFPTEVGTTFELARTLAQRVRAAVAAGQLPVVLSGNCGLAVGTLAGLALAGRADVGVVWLDAHGELNTPETTTSGYLDGMGLAVILGLAWRAMAASIPGYAPLPAERLLLAGVRDPDPPEEEALSRHHIAAVRAAELVAPAARFTEALDRLRARTSHVYVHVDPDVLDPREGRGNSFAPEGGIGRARLLDALREVRARFTVAAVGIGSYDPAVDDTASVLGTLLESLEVLAG